MPEPDDLVTIEQLPPMEAELARGLLEANGIPAVVLDENAHHYAKGVTLGVRLQVQASDAAEAQRLLGEVRSAEPDAEEAATAKLCPRCGSSRWRRYRSPLTATLNFLLLGLPSLILAERSRCDLCKEVWTAAD